MPWILGHQSDIKLCDDGGYRIYCFLCRGWGPGPTNARRAKEAADYHLLTAKWPEMEKI